MLSVSLPALCTNITLRPHDIIQCHIVTVLRLTIYHHQTTSNIITIFPGGIPHKDFALNGYKQSLRGTSIRISRRIYIILCNVLMTSAIWWAALCHHNMTLHYISLYTATFCSLTLGNHLGLTLRGGVNVNYTRPDRLTDSSPNIYGGNLL